MNPSYTRFAAAFKWCNSKYISATIGTDEKEKKGRRKTT
tara:strand:- start:195 stop:311 length:117 start_codon:yes stop_codon:yes gene_type:complete